MNSSIEVPDDEGGASVASTPTPLRRSALLQDRSRRTRQRLVRAALELWTSRGFETGIEDTTVEEIARAAGVTKGTFYFHFARKEQILLEMGWATAQVLYDEAARALAAGDPTDRVIAQVLDALSRRLQAVPRQAAGRAIVEFNKSPGRHPGGGEHFGFARAFALAFTHARDEGQLTAGVDPEELAMMLQALVSDAILTWAGPSGGDLPAMLRRRADILLAGAGIVAPPGGDRRSAPEN